MGVGSPPPPVARILDEYLEYSDPRRKASTLRNYRSHAYKLTASLGEIPAAELREDDLFPYFARVLEHRSYDTCRSHADLLRAALRHWWKKHQPDAPCPDYTVTVAFRDAVRVAGKQSRRREAYTPIEIADLLRVAIDTEPFEVAAVFMIGSHTGMRLGEILGMEWSGVDLGRGIYTPRHQRTRTGAESLKVARQRPVLLPPRIRQLLLEMPRDGLDWVFHPQQMRRTWVDSAIERVRVRAAAYGVSMEKTFHCLRHAFATEAKEAGWSDVEIQHQLGHERIETTRNTYFHPTSKSVSWGFLDDTMPESGDSHYGIRKQDLP